MGLRVIGGSLRGKKLLTLRGATVRPTADRTRESIFNILSDRVPKSVVLDLFAGSGAMGIEALSRGAESAVFIEKQKNAHSLIKQNITACALDKKATLIKWDIEKSLDCIKSFKSCFTLTFIDPPYNKQFIKPSLLALHNSKTLNYGAQIIVEHSLSEPVPDNLAEFKITDQRKYGKTLVSFLDYMVMNSD